MAAIARSSLVLAAAALLLLAAAARPSAAQTECTSKLLDCSNDLNATKPSAKCCASLNETVTTQLQCLCGLLDNPDLLKTLNVNLTQALELPKRCGIKGDTSLCKTKASAPPPASGSGSGSGATPASPSTPKGNNAAFAISWIGTYGLMILLALSWSVVA